MVSSPSGDPFSNLIETETLPGNLPPECSGVGFRQVEL